MMFRSKLATFASTLLLAGSVFAGQEAVCPNLSDIQNAGLTQAEELMQSVYVSYHISNYNTDTQWGFWMAPLEADSNETALEVGNELLMNMTAPGVPTIEDGVTICQYNTGNQAVFAGAVNQPEGFNLMQLKRFINKAH